MSGQRASTVSKLTLAKSGETEDIGLPVSQGLSEFSVDEISMSHWIHGAERELTLPISVTLNLDAAVDKPVEREHGCLKSTTHGAHNDGDILIVEG